MSKATEVRGRGKQRPVSIRPKSKVAVPSGPAPSDRAVSLNTFLTTVVAVASLAVAFAQFRLSEQQSAIAKSLAELEFAKAAAKFDFDTGRDTAPLGPEEDPHRISLPETIKVTPVSGVKSVFTMDGPVELTLTDEQGESVCNIEVRGLYVEENKYDLQLSQPILAEFRLLLGALRLNRVGISDLSTQPLVRYFDLLGDMHAQQYLLPNGMEVGGATEQTLVMYSSAWSGGTGFHFDKVDPVSRCPRIGKQLTEAVRSVAL
ncbi:MAG TPA: hypothetical protein VIT45_15475 [Allosphingosinicella sp.]